MLFERNSYHTILHLQCHTIFLILSISADGTQISMIFCNVKPFSFCFFCIIILFIDVTNRGYVVSHFANDGFALLRGDKIFPRKGKRGSGSGSDGGGGGKQRKNNRGKKIAGRNAEGGGGGGDDAAARRRLLTLSHQSGSSPRPKLQLGRLRQ